MTDLVFELKFSPRAEGDLSALEFDPQTKDLAKLMKVRKCLGLLETNPKLPGLQTHEFLSLTGANGEKIWEAYVENKTPAAWRVFWHYGPGRGIITIIAITAHP